jgi:hypothetical protein
MHITRAKVGLAGVAFAAAAVTVGSSLAAGATAAAKPAGGTIHVFVSSTNANENVPDTVLIVGAFSDHGVSPNNDSNKAVLKLKQGNIVVNVGKLNAITNSNSFGTFNPTSCSFYGKATAPVPFVSGTGAYVGVHGTIPITVTIAGESARLANGKCNEANNAPTPGFVFLATGSGKVSF